MWGPPIFPGSFEDSPKMPEASLCSQDSDGHLADARNLTRHSPGSFVSTSAFLHMTLSGTLPEPK